MTLILKLPSFAYFQQKRKLRIFISNTFNPAKPDAEDGEGTVASWELRVEGRLLEDVSFESNNVHLDSKYLLFTLVSVLYHFSLYHFYFCSILLTDSCVQV